MSERTRGRERDERTSGGPFGTVLGAAFGPFGAAVGSVVDANRVAFTFAVGTGVPGSSDDADDGFEGAATIEIEEPGDDGREGERENESENESGGADAETGPSDGTA